MTLVPSGPVPFNNACHRSYVVVVYRSFVLKHKRLVPLGCVCMCFPVCSLSGKRINVFTHVQVVLEEVFV